MNLTDIFSTYTRQFPENVQLLFKSEFDGNSSYVIMLPSSANVHTSNTSLPKVLRTELAILETSSICRQNINSRFPNRPFPS